MRGYWASGASDRCDDRAALGRIVGNPVTSLGLAVWSVVLRRLPGAGGMCGMWDASGERCWFAGFLVFAGDFFTTETRRHGGGGGGGFEMLVAGWAVMGFFFVLGEP